ncbi:MAG: hypothetical protein SVV03_04930 [Candidatus Nanohaloarchaea archaeon]|nr:hypothetical protein [Candidatus Nanohaloarchaea archaeon]
MDETDHVEPFEDNGPNKDFVEVVRRYFEENESLTEDFEEEYPEHAEKRKGTKVDLEVLERTKERWKKEKKNSPNQVSLQYYVKDYPFSIELKVRHAYPPVKGCIRDISSMSTPKNNPYYSLIGGGPKGILEGFYEEFPNHYKNILRDVLGRNFDRNPECYFLDSEELKHGKLAEIEVPKVYERDKLAELPDTAVELSKKLFDHYQDEMMDDLTENIRIFSHFGLEEGKEPEELQELRDMAEKLLERIEERKD